MLLTNDSPDVYALTSASYSEKQLAFSTAAIDFEWKLQTL